MWFYWHNHTEQVKIVVKACKKCQLVRRTRSIKSNVEDLKKSQYATYSKSYTWYCRPISKDQWWKQLLLWLWLTTILNSVRRKLYLITQQQNCQIFESKNICRYGVLKFIFDNGGEWSAEFDNLCKVYDIHHQYTAP